MLNFFRKSPKVIDLATIKKSTRVLIIDDDEPEELRLLLKRDGWKDFYLPDLDSLENRKLKESHIICIDIMGVGRALQCSNGMDLVKHIKIKHPEKKIILYSSVSKQDIFSDALDYVDKRLKKEASLIPFSQAVEEMARNTFSWEETIKYAYAALRTNFPEMKFEDFKAMAEKSQKRDGTFDGEKFAKKTGVALDVASKIASLVGLAL